MKHLHEVFTDQEFAILKEFKQQLGLNWHDFILTVVANINREKYKELAECFKRWKEEEVKTE